MTSSEEVLHTSAKDKPAVMHTPYKPSQRDINVALSSSTSLSTNCLQDYRASNRMVDEVNLTMLYLIQPDDDGTPQRLDCATDSGIAPVLGSDSVRHFLEGGMGPPSWLASLRSRSEGAAGFLRSSEVDTGAALSHVRNSSLHPRN
jgi:hypothetical protein